MENPAVGGCIACIASTCLFVIVASSIIFLGLKIDGTIDWTWATTLIPFYIMLGLTLLITLFASVGACFVKIESALLPFLGFLYLAITVTQIIMINLFLDKLVNWSLTLTLLPALIGSGLVFLFSFISLIYSSISSCACPSQDVTYQGAATMNTLRYSFSVFYSTSIFFLLFFIAQKVDGIVNLTWYEVFLPIFVFIGLITIAGFIGYILAVCTNLIINSKSDSEGPLLTSSSNGNDTMKCLIHVLFFGIFLPLMAASVGTYVLIVEKIINPKAFGVFMVFVPITGFILLAFMFICCILCCQHELLNNLKEIQTGFVPAPSDKNV